METGHIHQLLTKFLNKTASAEEELELWSYVEDDSNEYIIKQVYDQRLREPYSDRMPDQVAAEMLTAIVSVTAEPGGNTGIISMMRRHKWRWMAAVLLFLLVGGTAIFITKRKPQLAVNSVHSLSIMPGTQKATLTLGDGTLVELDKTLNSPIHQGNTQIEINNATLLYAKGSGKEKTVFNRLSTPRGGQYQLQLADGTKVWLNAASSIYYPVAFTGNTRTVEVTGEAYFQVASDKSHPFLVNIPGKETISVIGTEFNINAYDDENEIRTTLVTGAVKVNTYRNQILLKPRQQLRLSADRATTVVEPNANIAQVTAWKNGAFSFDGANIKEVMRQLSRWYNIEISFEDAVPTGTFNGEIGMDLTLQEVLDGLATAKINYKIVNKEKIVIYP